MSPDTRRGAQRIVRALAQSIRERDILTYTHSRRVATYAQRLARHLGWSRRLAHDLALTALVHDLGKTWMENEVLLKESALSVDERLEMERHPSIGARILEMYGAPGFMVEAVLHHHEAFDGHGYPDRLSGEDIPIAARILCVADAFDALTSRRPYKPALDSAQACERLRAAAATYFDPRVVSALLTLVETWPNFVLPRRDPPPASPMAGRGSEPPCPLPRPTRGHPGDGRRRNRRTNTTKTRSHDATGD